MGTGCVPYYWVPPQLLWQPNTTGLVPFLPPPRGSVELQDSSLPDQFFSWDPPPPSTIDSLGTFAQTVWKKAWEGLSWIDSAVSRAFRFFLGAQAQEVPCLDGLQAIIKAETGKYPDFPKNCS